MCGAVAFLVCYETTVFAVTNISTEGVSISVHTAHRPSRVHDLMIF